MNHYLILILILVFITILGIMQNDSCDEGFTVDPAAAGNVMAETGMQEGKPLQTKPVGCPVRDLTMNLTKDGKYQLTGVEVWGNKEKIINKVYPNQDKVYKKFNKLKKVFPDCTLTDNTTKEAVKIIQDERKRKEKDQREINQELDFQAEQEQRLKQPLQPEERQEAEAAMRKDCPLKSITITYGNDGLYLFTIVGKKGKTKKVETPYKEKAIENIRKLGFNCKITDKTVPKANSQTNRELRKKLQKLRQSSRKSNQKIEDLNKKLAHQKELTEKQHQKVRDLSGKLADDYGIIRDLNDLAVEKQRVINKEKRRVRRDERQSERLRRSYPENPDVIDLRLKIDENRFTLKKQGSRLNKIEDILTDTKACAENSKTLLKDIRAKLNNLNAYARDEEKEERNRETIHEIETQIDRCPPCPMYSTTSPVDVLEVKRQRVGSVAPLPPYLNYE